MTTLKLPAHVPAPSADAEQLRKAFQGWGTNESLIIDILAHRNSRSVLLWTLDPAERDAYLANESTKRLTSCNWVIVEIACTRSSLDLLKARQAYHARYKKSIEEYVAHHTTGDYRKLLVPLVSAFRYDGDEVNQTLAKSEAKIIHEKISEKAYNDEEIIRILSTRILIKWNLLQDLKADLNDEFLKFLRSTITCLTTPENEWALTRVVTTRAEVDMERIKEEYHRRNSVSLDRAIVGDTSGDYQKMLLHLIGHGDV
ncbi:hypothetical protein K2173_005129 [Erythroxylum novogranatense]|uniref:Annexin n=1 Tax=Erythroxylum novogranatense TaxID=1862640 RepID=A0AAV8TRC8_9ROSI|nr:hypothetical protein K2173_005129 [Erythroxylum novogranatense]